MISAPRHAQSSSTAVRGLREPSESLPLERMMLELERRPFRRLTDINADNYDQMEQKVAPQDLVQMVLVKRSDNDQYTSNFGTVKGKYVPQTPATAITDLKKLASNSGVKKAFVQYQPSSPDLSYDERIDEFCALLTEMKAGLPDTELVVDPIAICIRPTLRWGVPLEGQATPGAEDVLGQKSGTTKPEIDAKATLAVFEKAVDRIAQTGIDGILTLGRVNYEVAVAKAAIDKQGLDTRIFSFSTNSETAFAYFSAVVNDPAKARTGQKLLVGNHHEMLARALIDINEGTNVVLQKPIENFAIPQALSSMQDSEEYFLSVVGNGTVGELLNDYMDLQTPTGKIDLDQLYEKLKKVDLGAYEVSGSFITQSLISDSWSDDLGYTLQNERYLTAQAASGNKMRYIVGRGMAPYLDFIQHQDENTSN